MYALKWATAFNNHRFSARLLATSRSEVTNAVLKKLGNSAISLYYFVLNNEKSKKVGVIKKRQMIHVAIIRKFRQC